MTTDETPEPVRRAIVSLHGGPRPLGYHAVTDDDGRFDVSALPAGRYTLSASRASFVTIAHGATRPGWPGTPLAIAAGALVTGVRLHLARGAVVTGIVYDLDGTPVPDVDVRVAPAPGNRTPGLSAQVARTDDQGRYRVFGLVAGTYTASAQPRRIDSDFLDIPTDADVDAALRSLQQRPQPAASASQPGAFPAVLRASDFVPVYHSQAFSEDDAALVTVRTGEERAGVDIALQFMAPAVVEGRVLYAASGSRPEIELTLTRVSTQPVARHTAPVRPDGSFHFSSITPGRYLLVARSMSRDLLRASMGDVPPGVVVDRTCMLAAEDVWITAGDVTGMSLVLRPCRTIAGRIEFASALEAPPSTTPARVRLTPVGPRAVASQFRRGSAVVGEDGRFLLGEFGDVVPGRYLLQVEWPGGAWQVHAATAAGQDILDTPLEITGDSPETIPVAITLGDRRSSLSGVLETAAGRPAVDYTVLAFTTNTAWWQEPFRRVRATRPDTDGRYRIEDLPPGEYYLAALTEVAPEEWRDPAFLESIVDASIRLTIGSGADAIQHLRIMGYALLVPKESTHAEDPLDRRVGGVRGRIARRHRGPAGRGAAAPALQGPDRRWHD